MTYSSGDWTLRWHREPGSPVAVLRVGQIIKAIPDLPRRWRVMIPGIGEDRWHEGTFLRPLKGQDEAAKIICAQAGAMILMERLTSKTDCPHCKLVMQDELGELLEEWAKVGMS